MERWADSRRGYAVAAIGEIGRYAEAKQQVGYAGLGASVHDSGQKHATGKLTKQGRRELRTAMVEAAHHAARHHAHWRDQHQRLAARIGSQKAIVAVACKLLVAVWHVLSRRCVDRLTDQIAATFFAHAYRIGIANLPEGLSARQYAPHARPAGHRPGADPHPLGQQVGDDTAVGGVVGCRFDG